MGYPMREGMVRLAFLWRILGSWWSLTEPREAKYVRVKSYPAFSVIVLNLAGSAE